MSHKGNPVYAEAGRKANCPFVKLMEFGTIKVANHKHTCGEGFGHKGPHKWVVGQFPPFTLYGHMSGPKRWISPWGDPTAEATIAAYSSTLSVPM